MRTNRATGRTLRTIAAVAVAALIAAACGGGEPAVVEPVEPVPVETTAGPTPDPAPTAGVEEPEPSEEAGPTVEQGDAQATTTTTAEPETVQAVAPSLVVDPVTVSEGLNTFTIEGAGFDRSLTTWTLLCPLSSSVSESTPEDVLAAAMASITVVDCDLGTSLEVTIDDDGSFSTERDAIVIGNFMWVASDSDQTQVAAAAVFMEASEPEVVGEPVPPVTTVAPEPTATTLPESEPEVVGEPVPPVTTVAPEPTATTLPESEPEVVGEPEPPVTTVAPEPTATTLPESEPEDDLADATLAVLFVLDGLFVQALDLWESGYRTKACSFVGEARMAADEHLETFGADALSQHDNWMTWMEYLDSWEAQCANRGPDVAGYEPGEIVYAAQVWPDNNYSPNYVCQADGQGSLVDADGNYNCWTQEPQWTSPQAGDVPVVHPDTPPLVWHSGDPPLQSPRWTTEVDNWVVWCEDVRQFESCRWLLDLMRMPLDYLGARPDCVINAYTDRAAYYMSQGSAYSENHAKENFAWHLCATVIDPIVNDLPSSLPENDVGYRLSDTPGITLAERCRVVLTGPFPTIELENRGGSEGTPPTRFGQDCDAWANYVTNYRTYSRFPICSDAYRLAEEWMEHHHDQPEPYHRPHC